MAYDNSDPYSDELNSTNPTNNPWSSPVATPGYDSTYDPNTENLANMEAGDISQINSGPGNEALGAFSSQAMRNGPSTYANLANDQQDYQNAMAKSSNAATNASGIATGEGNLAMTGGLSSGAAERLQETGNKNLLSMDQGANNTTANNKMQIGMNDEQNRISQLGQVPTMENAANQAATTRATMTGQANQFDINQQVGAAQNQNDFNMNLYKNDMAGYGAQQTAQATQNSGSWLCTEALQDFGLAEWKYLLKLRRFAARKDMAVTSFYLYDCKTLIDRMKESGSVDWEKNKKFVSRIVELVKNGKMEKAYNLYFRVVKKLISVYWPECDHSVYLESQV